MLVPERGAFRMHARTAPMHHARSSCTAPPNCTIRTNCTTRKAGIPVQHWEPDNNWIVTYGKEGSDAPGAEHGELFSTFLS